MSGNDHAEKRHFKNSEYPRDGMFKDYSEKQGAVTGLYAGPDILFEAYKVKSIHWSVPWSDLMMTMFILFAVLFVYNVSRQDTSAAHLTTVEYDTSHNQQMEKETLSTPEQVGGISELFQISQRTLRAETIQDIASVELIKDRAIMIVLTGDVLFDSGRAELKPESMMALRKVADIVRDTPYVLNVIGHTDNIPISNDVFSSNWELSTTRACVTAKFMIDRMGIAPDRIFAAGYAQYKPVRSNALPAGRAANRRVEIIISKEGPYMETGREAADIEYDPYFDPNPG
jgi:chemotaxis protein MotB